MVSICHRHCKLCLLPVIRKGAEFESSLGSRNTHIAVAVSLIQRFWDHVVVVGDAKSYGCQCCQVQVARRPAKGCFLSSPVYDQYVVGKVAFWYNVQFFLAANIRCSVELQHTFTILPILLALLEFPPCLASSAAAWYFCSLCVRASNTSLGGGGGSVLFGALLAPPGCGVGSATVFGGSGATPVALLESSDGKDNTGVVVSSSFHPVEGKDNSFLPLRANYHRCSLPAIALAFEEMRTPYASGWEICIQKFGNAYQRKEIEKRMAHFKSTFTTWFIKRFSEIKCSQTTRAFLSPYSRAFRYRLPHV